VGEPPGQRGLGSLGRTELRGQAMPLVGPRSWIAYAVGQARVNQRPLATGPGRSGVVGDPRPLQAVRPDGLRP
jgi:hypothetical protein